MKTVIFLALAALFTSGSAFAGACDGFVIDCHDSTSGQDYQVSGGDTCVKCVNYSTDDVYFYAWCRADGGGYYDGGSTDSCIPQ